MSFTQYLRIQANDLWSKEQSHPFIKEIGSGKLPLEKFQYFMKQDYIFLIEYCRVISLCVAKTEKISDMNFFSSLLHETLDIEMDLHIGFCKDFDISKQDLEKTFPSNATESYTNHLLKVAYSKSALDIAVSILPCAWGYSEIGQKLKSNGLPLNAPLYSKWIELYSSVEFEELAIQIKKYIDLESQNISDQYKKNLENIFIISSNHEYNFWDSAYKLSP